MLNATMACVGRETVAFSAVAVSSLFRSRPITTGPGSNPYSSASSAPRVLISAVPALTANEKWKIFSTVCVKLFGLLKSVLETRERLSKGHWDSVGGRTQRFDEAMKSAKHHLKVIIDSILPFKPWAMFLYVESCQDTKIISFDFIRAVLISGIWWRIRS